MIDSSARTEKKSIHRAAPCTLSTDGNKSAFRAANVAYSNLFKSLLTSGKQFPPRDVARTLSSRSRASPFCRSRLFIIHSAASLWQRVPPVRTRLAETFIDTAGTMTTTLPPDNGARSAVLHDVALLARKDERDSDRYPLRFTLPRFQSVVLVLRADLNEVAPCRSSRR